VRHHEHHHLHHEEPQDQGIGAAVGAVAQSAPAGQPAAATSGPPPTSSMSGGGTSLPPAAQDRISRIAQGGSPGLAFTDYGQFAMIDDVGFDVLGAVVGLSIMHIGRVQLTGIRTPTELEAYSQALSAGILNALGRLQEEARQLGADGVLVSAVSKKHFDMEEHEYSVKGTAVRFRSKPGALRTPSGDPFVCSTPVITLYQMLRRGICPIALGYGVCVYHVPHRTIRQSLGQTFQNTEVPIFTEGWYTAREIALTRLETQLQPKGAQWILDVDVAEEAEVFGEHTSEFRAVGTGWVRRDEVKQMIPEIDLVAPSLIERGAVYPTIALPGTT